MKPHEETWETIDGAVEDGDYCAQDADGLMAVTAYSALDDADQAHVQAKGRLLIATAAPEMARALLAMGEVYEVRPTLEEWHLDDCIRQGPQHGCVPERETAQSALKKAGVLP